MRHGAIVVSKRCSSEGFTNKVVNGGVCMRHGAKINLRIVQNQPEFGANKGSLKNCIFYGVHNHPTGNTRKPITITEDKWHNS